MTKPYALKDYLPHAPAQDTIKIEVDPDASIYDFAGGTKPTGWGTSTRLFPFKSLLIYTEHLSGERSASIQSAIREFFQIKYPVEYFKTDLFVVHLNGEFFYRPSTKQNVAVTMETVEDEESGEVYVELKYNNLTFGYAEVEG